MKIGEIAQAASTAVETIRYYEREGLLPPPHRTSANYRRYEASHLERLLMIRHCRGLGMSLDEIVDLKHFGGQGLLQGANPGRAESEKQDAEEGGE